MIGSQASPTLSQLLVVSLVLYILSKSSSIRYNPDGLLFPAHVPSPTAVHISTQDSHNYEPIWNLPVDAVLPQLYH
jgi:hypothetical protein